MKKEPLFPIQVNPKDIDAVVITHAHLDHSGCVPSLFLQDSNLESLATMPTFELSELLIQDMIKISGFYLPFQYHDLVNMLNHARHLDFKSSHTIRDTSITFHESGHVIGGATILVESDGKKLFYTGDMNTRGSKVLDLPNLDVGEIDMLIIENTHSQAEQVPREQSERELVKFAKEVVEERLYFIPRIFCGKSPRNCLRTSNI